LGLLRVGKLERAQEEAPGVEFDGGDAGRHGRHYSSAGEVGLTRPVAAYDECE
jgi:hypothetical protein